MFTALFAGILSLFSLHTFAFPLPLPPPAPTGTCPIVDDAQPVCI